MNEKKSKTAKEIAAILVGVAGHLETEVEDHPTLRGLISQISRKAESIVKPNKEGKPVQLSYQNGQIVIENTPYLHRSAFGAWRFKLSEAKGEVTGSRVNSEGDEVPTFASTYDKDMGKNVLPADRKEQLLAVIGSFFPDSPVQEVEAPAE